MGGGDLNLKKSWHPATLRNIEKVWKLERKADEENKKLEQLRKEKEEERQLAELQALQEAAGLRKRSERLDWMYAAGPSDSASLVAEEKEAYLLGKMRVDKALVPEATPTAKFDASARLVYGMRANTVRDTQDKVREDPLLAIKKREQASLQAVLANPLKVKTMKRDLGIDDDYSSKKKDKKYKKNKKRHYSDDDESDSDDALNRQKRRRSEFIKRNDDRRPRYEEDRYHNNRINRRDKSPANQHCSRSLDDFNSTDKRRHVRDQPSNSKPSRKPEDEKERQRQERLRDMMDAAESHEKERKARVKEQRAVDAAEDLVDEEARKRRMKESGSMGQGFIMDMHRSVYASSRVSAAEMVQRSRAFAQREPVDLDSK